MVSGTVISSTSAGIVAPTVTFSLTVLTGAPVKRCLITVRFSGAIVIEPVAAGAVVVVVVTDVWATAGAAARTRNAATPAISAGFISSLLKLEAPLAAITRSADARPGRERALGGPATRPPARGGL